MSLTSQIRFSRQERATFQRVKPIVRQFAEWTCTGCGQANVQPLRRDRLGRCDCGKVVVLVERLSRKGAK